jgi:hypothetical protein
MIFNQKTMGMKGNASLIKFLDIDSSQLSKIFIIPQPKPSQPRTF